MLNIILTLVVVVQIALFIGSAITLSEPWNVMVKARNVKKDNINI